MKHPPAPVTLVTDIQLHQTLQSATKKKKKKNKYHQRFAAQIDCYRQDFISDHKHCFRFWTEAVFRLFTPYAHDTPPHIDCWLSGKNTFKISHIIA